MAELYLLHVLVPLQHRDEALELIFGDIGRAVFTEEQRQTALDIVEEKEGQNGEPSLSPGIRPDSETTPDTGSTQGFTFYRYYTHLSRYD